MAGILPNMLSKFAGSTPMSQIQQKYGINPSTSPAPMSPQGGMNNNVRRPAASLPQQTQVFNPGSGSL